MSKPDVFIVESLTFDDEIGKHFEGRILVRILRMLDKTPIYYYVRTRKELDAVLDLFATSQYRYLHLSCHGNEESVDTTLDDNLTFEDLGTILSPHLESRRLFVSSCDVVNDQFSESVIPSVFLSVAGPAREVGFAEATALSTSFYYLAFLRNNDGWKDKLLRGILKQLSPLLDMKLAYYWRDRRPSRG